MPDVEISYKGSQIASMSASGVKTLLTGDSFCEDDIIVSYTKPSAPTPTLQSKTVSPSTSQQTVSPDSGYDGLSQVTVNAMPSGSVDTPTTTMYDLGNNSVRIIPAVTTSSGYINGSTIVGVERIIRAADLVSGKKIITENGTDIDVTNYESVDVNVNGGGGGGSSTTVVFDDSCMFVGTYIAYIDGDGNYQSATTLATMSAVSYSMLSKSLLVWYDTVDPTMSGAIMGSPTGITLVESRNTGGRNQIYVRYYQVD